MRAIVNLKEGPEGKNSTMLIPNVKHYSKGAILEINAIRNGSPYAILIPYHNIKSVEFYGKADS